MGFDDFGKERVEVASSEEVLILVFGGQQIKQNFLGRLGGELFPPKLDQPFFLHPPFLFAEKHSAEGRKFEHCQKEVVKLLPAERVSGKKGLDGLFFLDELLSEVASEDDEVQLGNYAGVHSPADFLGKYRHLRKLLFAFRFCVPSKNL